mmetsp:Transcript_19434/g.65179  ORF Transcript_19434/g.65179 Transcript_19434/m.65179 type:complete len:204 (+) Transcript_19434:1157-1768(+)
MRLAVRVRRAGNAGGRASQAAGAPLHDAARAAPVRLRAGGLLRALASKRPRLVLLDVESGRRGSGGVGPARGRAARLVRPCTPVWPGGRGLVLHRDRLGDGRPGYHRRSRHGGRRAPEPRHVPPPLPGRSVPRPSARAEPAWRLARAVRAMVLGSLPAGLLGALRPLLRHHRALVCLPGRIAAPPRRLSAPVDRVPLLCAAGA